MRVGGGDLLRALEQAREHSSHVALLSYNRIDRDLQAMRTLFTVQVHQVAYTTLEEARQAVLEVARLGCRSIIGSSTVVELAEQAGLHGVLSLSEDTARKALEEAMGSSTASAWRSPSGGIWTRCCNTFQAVWQRSTTRVWCNRSTLPLPSCWSCRSARLWVDRYSSYARSLTCNRR